MLPIRCPFRLHGTQCLFQGGADWTGRSPTVGHRVPVQEHFGQPSARQLRQHGGRSGVYHRLRLLCGPARQYGEARRSRLPPLSAPYASRDCGPPHRVCPPSAAARGRYQCPLPPARRPLAPHSPLPVEVSAGAGLRKCERVNSHVALSEGKKV